MRENGQDMSRRISFFVTGSLDPLRTLEFRGLLTALRARLSSGTIAAGRIIAVVDRTDGCCRTAGG